MTSKVFLYLFLTVLTGLSGSYAQTLAEARKLYEEGHYAEALPVFARYVKQVPANGNYNLWYGVCCFQTGDAVTSVKYLETAVKRRIPSGQLWLSRAYDKTYRFEDAISTMEDYIGDLKRRRRPTEEADSLLSVFRAHLRMLKGVEKVCVTDSFVVAKEQFLEAYRLSSQAGKLFSYAERFPDSKRTGKTVYENELGNKILYSEADGRGYQHLLSSVCLLDEWSAGTPLAGYFPDSANVAYPYLMSDGMTLYYASDGPESMGGYDIFVTRYNTNTDAYLRPDNVGMPFNSPYNDYMYVVDEYANLGWFASDRYQAADSVCIYVFIPNVSKQVYDYEQMDTEKLRSLAALLSLRDTWTDQEQVEKARTRLAEIGQTNLVTGKNHSFEFIIDDRRTYYAESDFHSSEALGLFRQYEQKRNTLQQQQKRLDELRMRYISAKASGRSELRPAILDLEQNLRRLEAEISQIAKQVRNAEIGSGNF